MQQKGRFVAAYARAGGQHTWKNLGHEEAENTVDVDGMTDQDNLIEGVEFVDENPVSPHVGIDNEDEDEDGDGGNVLDKETVDEVVEGDGVKVESYVISKTHETGNEVGRINDVNDREMIEADESVAEDETNVFMRELNNFYRERATEFKHPKFYGEPLDCLKLWRTVVQLGGYERHDGIADSGEPTTKDRSSGPGLKREKNLKSIGSFKQRKLGSVEQTDGAMVLVERDKQLDASVVDIGPPVDWVKISVRETKDCFEVYALVPGLLREEFLQWLIRDLLPYDTVVDSKMWLCGYPAGCCLCIFSMVMVLLNGYLRTTSALIDTVSSTV